MSTKLERRILTTEFRTAKAGKSLVGYAAVFDSDSEDLGGFIERIAPGAFTDVLADGPDCCCLFNHDASALLGRTTSGTLTLEQDSKGLRYLCDVADTQTGRDVLTLAARGDLNKSSFAFRVSSEPGSEKWYDAAGHETSPWCGVRRIIYRIGELADCSPVTRPAYPDSSVQARSLFYFPEGRGAVATGNARENAQAFLTARTTIRKARRDLDTGKELRKMSELRKELFL
jgi:HK97 family phage prohead protease